MTSFHRGILWGAAFSLPLWAWIVLAAYAIGRSFQ